MIETSLASKSIQALHGFDDIFLSRSRINRAQPQRNRATQSGRRQQSVAVFHHVIYKPGLKLVTFSETETNCRHLCGRKNFATFSRAQLALGQLGQLKAPRDRQTKRGHAESLQRQPDLERAKTARQLNAVVARVDFLTFAINVAQIIGLDFKSRFQNRGIAHQDASTIENFYRFQVFGSARAKIRSLAGRVPPTNAFGRTNRRWRHQYDLLARRGGRPSVRSYWQPNRR